MKLSEAVNVFVLFLNENKDKDIFELSDDFILARNIIRNIEGLEKALSEEVYK